MVNDSCEDLGRELHPQGVLRVRVLNVLRVGVVTVLHVGYEYLNVLRVGVVTVLHGSVLCSGSYN